MGSLKKFTVISLSSMLLFSFIFTVESANSNFLYGDMEISESGVFINIASDQDFINYSFSGSGTALDPYLIENYVIDSFDYGVGIHVEDTTKHFVIRNCSIKALWTCIFIRDVADYTVTITNNSFNTIYSHQASSKGLDLRRTNGASITNNLCKYESVSYLDEYGDFGIHLKYTNNTLVENNICLNQSDSGIFSIGSENNTFSNNSCSFNFCGLMIVDARNALIEKNVITNNIQGFEIIYADAVIKKNSFGYNERDGLMTYSVFDSEIISNTMEFNGWIGIRSWDTHRCKITYNLIRNNSEYGVSLDVDSRFNTVHHNYFIHNNIDGTSQACDSGKNNIWFDKESEEGNFWSDWNQQNSTYHINGKAENNDLYPLDENLERTTTTIIPFLIIFFFIFVISINRNRQNSKKN